MTQKQIKAPQKQFRPLEELNVIDNFLFQQLLSQGEDGEEFARILLKTFLGKEIRNVKITPQKGILGTDTDRHGIRMDAYIEDVSDDTVSNLADAEIIPDVYDIEPNLTYEKDILPKRMRYYHGLIDTQLLSAGSGYQKLPNVIIFIILPYDPFGQNRMIYTIQNRCMEDPAMPYNDGAKKIFLYTKGNDKNAGNSLKDMLKYIEESTDDNVTNEDIASIQQLVNKVKHKKEVGINYMKSWEYEQMVHDEAFSDGFNDGFSKGYNESSEQLSQLILCLTDAGRTEDLKRAATDKEYRKTLLKEFDIES